MKHRAKKHLGQNFLTSQSVIEDAVSAGEVSENDVVLEIGPGKGALTAKILETGAKVVAVEKDSELVSLLQEKFSKEVSSGQLQIINEDILEFGPSSAGLKEGEYKLIANIPYYITGEILETFLEKVSQPKCAVLIVQKEVAQRIVARDGKESILSISVKVFGTPKIVRNISRGSFSPSPDVDSALLLISDISRDRLKPVENKDFFGIVKLGFAHKRKVLASNLSSKFSKSFIENFLKEHGRSASARAEELSVEDWLKLSRTEH